MVLAEPYPTPSPSPTSGILNQVTSSLSGLVPPGLVNTGIAGLFAVTTMILAALGYNHARRGSWLSGWLSGPVAVLTAVVAASYGASGLPTMAGVDQFALDPQAFVVDAVVALLAGALVGAAAWPVAAHASAYRGSPTTLADLRDWVLQGDRLYAGGGAAAGAAVAWIVLGPLMCVAGAVLGVLVTVTAVTLHDPATPAVRPGQPRPPVLPQGHRPPPAPVPPVVSDENW